MKRGRDIWYAFPYVAVAILDAILTFSVWQMILYRTIGGINMAVEAWMNQFFKWSIVIIIVATAAALVWHFLAFAWSRGLNRWDDSDRRLAWTVLLIISVIPVLPAVIFIDKPRVGFNLVWVFFLLDSIICYYVPTLLFSPSSYKYIPVLAKQIRRW